MEYPRDVQVRTIDGHSVTLSVNADETVKNMKVQLQQRNWLPDSDLPLHFHLFLRGGKLDAATQLGSLHLLDGDFLVLVPFTRKNETKRRKLNATEHHSPAKERVTDEENSVCRDVPDSMTAIAPNEAIWHAIVADLAAVNAASKEKAANNIGEENNLRNGDGANSGEFIRHTQRSEGLNQDSLAERRIRAIESRDNGTSQMASSGNTNTFREAPKVGTMSEDFATSETADEMRKRYQSQQVLSRAPVSKKRVKGRVPTLPPVLEKLSRVFASLNTVYGFLQKQHMQATWKNVKQALQQLCCPQGEEVTVQEIQLLAELCPRLVVLSNFTEGENFSFYIDLFDPSTLKIKEQVGNAKVFIAPDVQQIGPSDTMPSSVGKQVSDRVITNAVGRRQKAFEKVLTMVVEYLQKSGKNMDSAWNGITLQEVMMTAKTLAKEEDTVLLKASLPKPPRGHKQLGRCTSVGSLGALEMMEHLKNGLGSLGQFVHCEHLKHRDAVYGELQKPLAKSTQAALKQMGISQLYTHQTQAINAAMSGQNVIVATSTASGKSLCYNIPVLDEMFQNPESCALYLFPTKALAQDQLRALQEISMHTELGASLGVYDGDTPQDCRAILRDCGRLLITNPDMLHVSILPSHRQFARILSNLRYVVVDEAHAYRGVFGCHTALILRRLRRLCHYVYGTEPVFIVCSATVANPCSHAQELLGLGEIEVVQNDGSSCGDKFFVLWNPPATFAPFSRKKKDKFSFTAEPEQSSGVIMKRASPIVEVAALLAEMVQHGLRCIAFCKSRKLCELVYNYARLILKETAPDLIDSIRSYRGGYSAQERRRIESNLFGGKLRGVVATNALELGVDIGSLDATLHLGFPGTVASLWQQSGRAGRREKASLSVYVAFGSPLDQHFMKTPSRLFARPIENAQVDAHNQQVLEQHLACAAVEYPLHMGHDDMYFGSGLETAIKALVNKGRLGRHPSNGPQDMSWVYIGQEKCPSHGVSIRAIDEMYKVIDVATNEVIEEVQESKAFFLVYEGAVYMNQGKTYLVKTLDLAAKVAVCQEADLKYYTKTRDFTDIHVTGGELAYPRNICENKYRSTTAQASTCNVTTHWIGYRRIWQGTNEQFDSVDLFLPDMCYDSQAAWIRVPQKIRGELAREKLPFRAGLHAANHALLNVMPLYIMCNPSDLGTECANPMDTRYFPERLLLFDRHPGGIGIAAQACPMFAELLQAALELLTACECPTDDGCPCCVQTLDCSEYNEVIHKRAALVIIQGVIEAEDTFRGTREQAPASADGFLKDHVVCDSS